MKSNILIIEEKGQSKESSKSIVFNVIDHQINQHKLNYLTNWERNHTISDEVLNQKIRSLQSKKEKIKEMFDQLDVDNDMVDVMLTISIRSSVSNPIAELKI